jgi:hypothetical protein
MVWRTQSGRTQSGDEVMISVKIVSQSEFCQGTFCLSFLEGIVPDTLHAFKSHSRIPHFIALMHTPLVGITGNKKRLHVKSGGLC